MVIPLSWAMADDYIALSPPEHDACVLRLLQEVETTGYLSFTGNIKANYSVMNQLVEAGYLFNPGGGTSEEIGSTPTGNYVRVKNVMITLKGRDYLKELKSATPLSMAGRTIAKFAFWVVTIVISTLITLFISRQYELRSNKPKKDK